MALAYHWLAAGETLPGAQVAADVGGKLLFAGCRVANDQDTP